MAPKSKEIIDDLRMLDDVLLLSVVIRIIEKVK